MTRPLRGAGGALLILALALASSVPLAASPFSPASDALDVLDYDIELEVGTLEQTLIDAVVRITFTVRSRSERIELHLDPERLTVDSVRDDTGKPLTAFLVAGTPGRNGASGTRLAVEFTRPVERGESRTIEIRYRIAVAQAGDQRGLFFDPDHHGARILSTRNWPYFARAWLPSNDHPSDAARFRFTLLVPPGSIGVANGERIATTAGSAVVWEQKRPIPTYALQVAIGELASFEVLLCFDAESAERAPCSESTRRLPLIFYHPPLLAGLAAYEAEIEEAADALLFFSAAFGDYPFAKAGFVSAPHPFSMESASIVTLVSPQHAVHEMLHHWWGNGVQILTWGDFWISEGVTTYFTGFYDEMTSGANTACSVTGRRLSVAAGQDPLDLYNADPYCIGSAAIHDFREDLAVRMGLSTRDPVAIEQFLEVFRRTWEARAFRATGTRALSDTLKFAAFEVLCAAGEPAAWTEVSEWVDAWRDEWFSDLAPAPHHVRRRPLDRPPPQCQTEIPKADDRSRGKRESAARHYDSRPWGRSH